MSEADNSILKNTGIMTAATLLSRMTGLLRTWAMAFALGNTLLTSAYQIAYNMPSMIYELAASGILGTAFLPLYLLSKERNGKEGADRFSSNILSIVVIGLGALALAGSFFAPQVIATQTFTVQNSESQELAIFFFRIFSVQILLYGLGAVITSILNAERVFIVPSLAPVLNNIVVIITMFGYVPISQIDTTFAMWWLAVGTSFGVLVQFGAQIPVLIKRGFHYCFRIDLHDPMLKEALRIALPTFVYVIGTMVTFSCRNAFGLQASPNGPSTLNYAWTWYQLPYGVVAVSLSTVLLTELSDCAAKEDWQGFKHHVTGGLRKTFFLIIPLAAMVGCLATPLMQLFQAGAFNSTDVTSVAVILALWTLSLPVYAGYMYMYRVFASMRQFLTFALVDLALRTIQIAGYWFLCKPEILGLVGIPLSDLVFYGLMMIATVAIVQNKIGGFGVSGIISMFLRVAIASTLGVAAALACSFGLSAAFESLNLLPAMARGLIVVIGAGSVGLSLSFALCKLFRVSEFALLANIFHKIGSMFSRNKSDQPHVEAAEPLPAIEQTAPQQQHRRVVAEQPAPSKIQDTAPLRQSQRGKHAARTPDEHNRSGENARMLNADETGAIMGRAKHAPRATTYPTAPCASETGAIMRRAKHASDPLQDPGETGAIMRRARHTDRRS
ncbi:MAG: murein biosynthesis integral membrane protein MurJ [Raoultibacter sp.]